jgi:hypothetical protein
MVHFVFDLVHAVLLCFGPPGPDELSIDPTDGDSVLRAACILDHHGEWERALGLYTLAAELLRGRQDGVYAENRRKEVQEKINQLSAQ